MRSLHLLIFHFLYCQSEIGGHFFIDFAHFFTKNLHYQWMKRVLLLLLVKFMNFNLFSSTKLWSLKDLLLLSASCIHLMVDYSDCFHFHFSFQLHQLLNLRIQILQTQISYLLRFHYLFSCAIFLDCLRKMELGFYKSHWKDKCHQTRNYMIFLSKRLDSSLKQSAQIKFTLNPNFQQHQIQIL